MAYLTSISAWIYRLSYLALFLAHKLHAANYAPNCNSDVYGKPLSVQCIATLARFPLHDTAIHYFVEQQMRTAPPAAIWSVFRDPRPPSQKQTIVQLPKWISSGTCNVALFSFTYSKSKDERIVNSSPALAWSDIYNAGFQLDSECLAHNKGGAIIVKDIGGRPGLSVYMWEDGAPFEFLMNHQSIDEFPAGMSPYNPDIGPSLFSNATFITGLQDSQA